MTFKSILNKGKSIIESVANKFNSLIDSMPNLSHSEKQELKERVEYLASQEVNFLVVGATGVGKSSTVNALFHEEGFRSILESTGQAKVGTGPNPETQDISPYRLGNLIFWDTPGLGESPSADMRHSRSILTKLREKNPDGKYLIDFVLVLIDGAGRDCGATFQLLNNIGAQLTPKEHHRILVAVNRIDMLRGGRGWDDERNCPKSALEPIIEETLAGVKNRIKVGANLNIEPVAYCAGFSDEFGSRDPYNIAELLCAILTAIEPEKRIVVVQQTQKRVIETAKPKQRKVIKEKTSAGLGSLAKVGLGLISACFGIGAGCFITTAVCQSRNKADNCHMLTTFRKFRDDWLQNQEDGPELINTYYRVAPSLVEWIDKQPSSKAIYDRLYYSHLRKCYKLIKKHQFKRCQIEYTNMVNELIELSSKKPS